MAGADVRLGCGDAAAGIGCREPVAVRGWLRDGEFVRRADRLAEEIIHRACQFAYPLHHRAAFPGALAFEFAVGERAQSVAEIAHHHVVDVSKPDEPSFVNGGHDGMVASISLFLEEAPHGRTLRDDLRREVHRAR